MNTNEPPRTPSSIQSVLTEINITNYYIYCTNFFTFFIFTVKYCQKQRIQNTLFVANGFFNAHFKDALAKLAAISAISMLQLMANIGYVVCVVVVVVVGGGFY